MSQVLVLVIVLVGLVLVLVLVLACPVLVNITGILSFVWIVVSSLAVASRRRRLGAQMRLSSVSV